MTDKRPALLFVLALMAIGFTVTSLPASTAANGNYEVTVQEQPAGPGIGVYTATTGLLHPVTAAYGPQNVLFGGGAPSSSWTTLHSYTSGTAYTQRGGQTFQSGVTPPLFLEPFVVPGEEAVPVGTSGFRTHYRVTSSGTGNDDLDIFQTVAAIGTAFNDSAVEITTEIFNLGTSDVQIGVRYLLDFQIGSGDDGPGFQFRNPDGPVTVLEVDQMAPAADTFEVIDNNDPGDFACIFGPTNTPFPFFGVGGSVRGPTSLNPTAPTALQFVSWPHASGLPAKFSSFPAQDPFSYTIGPLDAATCVTSFDDSGANYFWGESQASAFTIAPGQSARTTAYLFAFLPGGNPQFPPVIEDDCSDGVDNDIDGMIDADDPDCDDLLVDLASFEVESARRGILLSWKTASEVDNAGFMVLRGISPAGPFLPMQSFLIPAKGSSFSGAAYELLDSQVRRKAVYYYKLVDVDLNGTMTEHGPVAGSWGKPAKAPGGRRNR